MSEQNLQITSDYFSSNNRFIRVLLCKKSILTGKLLVQEQSSVAANLVRHPRFKVSNGHLLAYYGDQSDK